MAQSPKVDESIDGGAEGNRQSRDRLESVTRLQFPTKRRPVANEVAKLCKRLAVYSIAWVEVRYRSSHLSNDTGAFVAEAV